MTFAFGVLITVNVGDEGSTKDILIRCYRCPRFNGDGAI